MRYLLTLTVIAALLMSSPSWAASLVSDPNEGVATYDVEVDGTVTSGVPASADGSLNFNVDGLGPGPHTFRARAYDASGWASEWSDPYSATKPQTVILTIVP